MNVFIRPARSSSFPDPTDMEPYQDDEEAAWLDERAQAEESQPPPPPPACEAHGYRKWTTAWTPDQLQDLDDLSSFLDWWYEERDNRWQ